MIKSNFRRKKHYTKTQGSKFLGSSFNNGGNIRSPIQFEEKKSDAWSHLEISIMGIHNNIADEIIKKVSDVYVVRKCKGPRMEPWGTQYAAYGALRMYNIIPVYIFLYTFS